ncbi:MAG: hypothetical protein JJE16_03835 [Nitrospiraceae bacterium]|nr:hypothetical protein [Nitrospiraceae bacterium]
MSLEETRDKLEEAKFFLRYPDEAQNLPQPDTQTSFRYYLSAFLGTAYSVQQAGEQYEKLFVQWFTALSLAKQALWDCLMNNRGHEIHAERTKTVTKEKAMSTPLLSSRDFLAVQSAVGLFVLTL